ncbi:MAG: hypothetical protein BWZ11_01034 [Bacteroidetes bacterium ADurb.BinA395]|nr:MAG: hypothetical protein BWZ11_01034 [Bacteroidetes bacterium ADurb.BinA395]
MFYFLIDIDLSHNIARFYNVFGAQYGLNGRHVFLQVFANNQFFFIFFRIIDDDFQHETIDLRFGKRICSFLFDGILCGHHQKRFFQFERFFANRYLPFLHGFEQGTLHFGRSSVDFVRQNEVGKNRAFTNAEFFFFLTVNHCSDNVGRQQVGCKLNSAEISLNQVRKCFDGQRFGKAGYPFQ